MEDIFHQLLSRAEAEGGLPWLRRCLDSPFLGDDVLPSSDRPSTSRPSSIGACDSEAGPSSAPLAGTSYSRSGISLAPPAGRSSRRSSRSNARSSRRSRTGYTPPPAVHSGSRRRGSQQLQQSAIATDVLDSQPLQDQSAVDTRSSARHGSSGEEYFLMGSYKKAVEFWKRELQEATARGGRRCGLLQTRYYLALLYCHLYHYNLNDAQGMCDQLVKELLIRSHLLSENEEAIAAAKHQPVGRPLKQVHPDAALAVIRSMGRFMAAYFTNQLLYVFPPHSVCVLAPLYAPTDKCPRVVPLQRGIVSGVIRDQNLSSVWTVEYTLDLLLVGGLISEAAWLADRLGDWKMSVSMSVVYNLHRSSITEEQKGEFPAMPLCLSPAHIFQEKLQSFLGHPPKPEAGIESNTSPKQFTDPIEEEDADLLFSSVQEMLKAAVMADAEILTETLQQLTESAKELGRKFSGLVPYRLYLPAPPLYCPQPSSVSEEDPSDGLLESEKHNRQKLSGILQRILLLFRAAHCSLPAAQWYIKQIKRARKIMQKIRAKASLPPLDSLPENLLNYANSRTVLLKPGPSGEPVNDLVSCSVVVCFRELCALCWMLHVRERLSISCRQYQRARDNGKLFKSADEVDSCVIEHCFEALEWACRMLLFTRATNCEELIQDLILSLISELPPVKKVAEIMVRAFPNPEDVRVPLREKYHSVQQRLRHSKIRGLHGEEMMSVIIHNMQRVRIKTLKRVQRNIGSVEMHLWEPPLDESLEDESHCYDKYSLGTTSLSRSTLTDLGRPQIYSDTDTLSDALMCTGGDDSIALGSHTGNVSKAAKKKSRKKRGMPRESGPSPPKVGTWEFECNDEEYTRFLDLFLSYLLDRDLLSGEPGIPFLSSFSSRLREHELNSLVFDVHTTLKRKLVRAGIRSVFSAGSCFTLNSENVGDSVGMEGESPRTQGAVDPTHGVSSTIILGKPITAGKKSFPNVSRRSVRSGLFGLKDHGPKKPRDNGGNLTRPSLLSPLWDEQYSYRLIQNKHCNPSEELGEELQAKYSNEAKLVEWMIRWSDRRLFWSAGRVELRHVAATTAIRVKTSSAALLTSIWLLEKPYLGNIYIQYAPPSEHIAAPVLPSEVDSNVQDRPSGAIEYLQSERSSPCTVHDRSGEESASIALSKISRVSERSPERPSGLHEKSEDYASVLCDNHQSDQTLSESDDQGEESDTQRSMKIAVSIRSVLREPENLPPDSTHQSPEPKIREGSQPPVPAGFTSPAPKPPVPAGYTSPAPQPSVPAGFTSPAPQPGPFLPPPAPTTDRTEPAIPNGGQTPQPVTSSEAVRQLLQDEMFRLLQLQQINFMSLMQVVGSSFAAIPALQHVLEQTAQIRSPVMNPMGERSALQVIPQAPSQHTSAEPVPDRQRATDPVQTESAGTAADKTARTEQNNKENLQKLPELHIPPGRVNTEGEIPARLGLLSTAPPHGLPLITPPSGPPKTPSLIRPPATKNHNGFPLLKLQSEPQMLPLRPPLREAWAPLRMPTPVSAHITQRIGAGDASIAPHWAESASRGPPAHESSSQTAAQQFYRDKDTKEKQQIGLFSSEQSKAGIPLLHLRSDPVLYVPVPQKPSTKAPTLLHLVPDPSAILPPAKLTLLKTNLPQRVQIDDQRRDPGQNAENHQQLRANILPSEEETKAEDSIKRKNRRTLKEKKEKVASVTFRLEDSIIAPNNLDEVAPSEIVHHDKQDLEDGSEFAIPLGSFDSLLSREIPAAPILSMAEVHFLASTMKRPPEIRDASTNTDSGSVQAHKTLIDSGTKCEGFPRPGMAASHLDPEVLPSDIQEQRPPELFLNLQYPHAPQPEQMPIHFGHHMEVEEFPDSDSHDVPSSAGLHLLAASVTNAQPLAYIEPTDVLEGPHLVDWAPSAVDRTTHQALSSDLTSVPIRELAPRVWTPRVRSTGAISRLQEMDAQLQALQNMADGMELDFANTKLLVNTLETLTSAVQPEPKGVTPRGAGAPQRVLPSSDLTLEDLAEEEEYNLTSPADIGLSEHPLEVLISPRAPGRSKDMDESSLQDALQMTGLSDMADILGDLIAGGVSASDLGLTPAQAEKLSRMKLRGTSKKTTSERTDLLRWMKKKQRERLAEHRRRLQELREKEHKPFQTQKTANSSLSSRTLREEQQVKDDRDRSLLMEHHSHRVSDAMGLMQELLSEAKQIPSVVHQPGTYKVSPSRRPASRPSPTGGRGAVRNVSANQEKRRLPSRGGTSQPRSRSTPAQTQIRGTATFVLPKSNWEPEARTHSAPSYSVHRRHDPSLPGDRLSQITRRGLLPTRNRINVQNKNTKPVTKAIAKQTYRQGKSSKGTSPLSQYGEFQPEDYERDIVSPWEIPDEINRILNSDRNSILSQGSTINGEADSRIRNLDNSSDSTGSILSKLDWKAIEDMVASVGSTQM